MKSIKLIFRMKIIPILKLILNIKSKQKYKLFKITFYQKYLIIFISLYLVIAYFILINTITIILIMKLNTLKTIFIKLHKSTYTTMINII